MRKKRFSYIGTTLFEAVFVCSFIGMLFLLLYKSLDISMKTNYSVFNGDSVVKQSAFSFEEIISKRIRETDAEAISIFNVTSQRQYVDAKAPGSTSFSTANQRITAAISFPGHNPNWTPANVLSDDELKNELGVEIKHFNLKDAGIEELKAYQFDSIFIYYYDRDGKWDREILGQAKKYNDIRKEWELKYTMYEIVLKVNPDTFQKKMSQSPDIIKLENFLKGKFNSPGSNIKYRKISRNLVYFQADMSTYPLLNFKSMFMYGRGGNSSRQVIEDAGNAGLSEVFEISFSAMPYYY